MTASQTSALPSPSSTSNLIQLPPEGAFPDSDASKKQKRKNAVQGVSAAGARALVTQTLAFYFRYPVKAFFRQRIDYMQVARAINPRVQANQGWTWRTSTFPVLYDAIKEKGWGFIPKQVLPPLTANAAIGALLYTSYLNILQGNYSPSTQGRIYPPPPPETVFRAGAMAGAIQSLAAAPLDALTIRFDVRDMLEKKYPSMLHYARHKLHSIGVRGVLSGYTLSLTKDTLGYALFFTTFEYVKQQAYYNYLIAYYGSRANMMGTPIRPHWSLEPTFLLLAGTAASFSSSLVFHPISRIQAIHYSRLETIDYAKSAIPSYVHPTDTLPAKTRFPTLSTMAHNFMLRAQHSWVLHNMIEYRRTYDQCRVLKRTRGGWRRWLYRGFWLNTVKNTPSTAAALIVFEMMRRRFGEGEYTGGVTVKREGHTIVL